MPPSSTAVGPSEQHPPEPVADDARADSASNSLRPYSTPIMASRFPSLRRLNSSDPYRHRSLPAGSNSPESDRPDSEITFAVLYDDGPDYHIGHFDDQNSIRSGRVGSSASYAPSFRTRDSRNVSEEHMLSSNPDWVANQRLLAEGHLNANDHNPFADQHAHNPRYPTPSEETLAMNALHHGEDGRGHPAHGLGDHLRAKNSHDSWCTCDDDHVPISRDVKDPSKFNTDVEAQHGPSTPTPFLSDKKTADAHIVKFNGPNDPANPKNWTSKKRWGATAVMASFTFVSPLASSMVAPALPQIMKDLHITNSIEGQIVLSIFVLAYAVGPMVLGPLSELYGRVVVLQSSNLIFLGFNLACGFAQTKQQLMAFRFLSGLGGSAPLAIGGGVLGDLFKPEERGKAMGLYAMGPLLGPALGPIVGAWVAEKSTWRWMFWATTVVDFIILIAGFFFQPESYSPYILHKKAKQLRKQTGNPLWRAEGEGEVDQPIWKKIVTTMGRSFGMLFTQPIVQILALYMAFSYGILYLMLSTYFELFHLNYNESIGVSGLNYISLGLGFFVGAPVCGKTNDKIYQKLKQKDPRGKGKPEFRMPLIVPFSLLVPIGLLTYGWSAQAHTHWIVPNIGAFIFGIGTIAAFQCVTTYLVDSYARHAASAVAAVTVLRSLAGFGFPLFAPAMYKALHYGWGNTLLAIAAVGIGMPVPVLLWIFGEKLRKVSKLTMKGPPPGMGGPGGPPGGPGGKGPMGPGGPPGPGKGAAGGGFPAAAPGGPPAQAYSGDAPPYPGPAKAGSLPHSYGPPPPGFLAAR